MIASKYGIQRWGWCSEEVRGSYEVSLWRYIRNNWGAFSSIFLLRSSVTGDGDEGACDSRVFKVLWAS